MLDKANLNWMYNVKSDKRKYAYGDSSLPKKKEIGNYSYLLSSAIGEGFSSVVYRGKDQRTDEEVAIKVIERRLLANDIQRDMLVEEINLLKVLEHRNVIRCLDVLHTQNNTYIITEFCNEGDLSQVIGRQIRLGENELVPYLRDLIAGFLYLADNGIVHRDLKPANLFLKDGMIKIGDFGFAKRLDVVTKSTQNVGTPFYMAPEALKESIYSLKSDVFAIGALTYELLYSRPPWKADSEQKLYQHMISVTPQYTSTRSQKINAFIQRCLMINPAERMDIEEMSDWLSKFTNMSRETVSTNESSLTVLRPKDPIYLKLAFPKMMQCTQEIIALSQGNTKFAVLVQTAKHVEKYFNSSVRSENWESALVKLFGATQALLRTEMFLLGTGKGLEEVVVALYKYFKGIKTLICSLYQPEPVFEAEEALIGEIEQVAIAGNI